MGMSWVSKERGSVPISWGVDTKVAENYPALLEFYAASAGVNDSFFAGVSGAGYSYAPQMPNFDQYDTCCRPGN